MTTKLCLAVCRPCAGRNDDQASRGPGRQLRHQICGVTDVAAICDECWLWSSAGIHGLWLDGLRPGLDVCAHDRIVAATAITAGWWVGTANVRHFEPIHSIDLIAITLTT